MKSIFTLLCCIITIISCSQKKSNSFSLKPIEFKNKQNENSILLDVRTLEEVNAGKIKGASHLDFYSEKFEKSLALIQKDKEVFVYCLSGSRSAKAAKKLNELGQFKVYNLSGGIKAWKKQNLEIVKTNSLAKTTQNLTVARDSLNEIINKNNTVFMAFQTKWCAPCRKMNPTIETLEKTHPEVAFLRIDMDQNTSLSEKFNVQSIPTFIVYKNKKESWRGNGIQKLKTLNSAVQ